MTLPLLKLPEQAPTDDIDEEIIEIFVEEVEEVLEEMKSSYEVWRESPADAEALQTLRRAFHTLKGSGRLVGATVIGELGWVFESMLNRIIDGTMQRNPLMFQLLDSVPDVVPDLILQYQAEETLPPYATHLLISQAEHLTQTKGAELGEFVGEGGTEGGAYDETADAIVAEESVADDEPITADETVTDDDEFIMADEAAGADDEFIMGDEAASIDDEFMMGDEAASADDEFMMGDEAASIDDEFMMGDEAASIDDEFMMGDEEASIDDEFMMGDTLPDDDLAMLSEDNSTLLDDDDHLDASSEEMLRDIFQNEARGHLKNLKDFLVACHQSPPGHMTEEVIRILHTLNGSSRSMGFDDIAELAVRMEHFSRAAFEHKLLLKKQMIGLFVESGKTLEHTLNNQGHTTETDAAKHAQLVMTWDKLLTALPKSEASLEMSRAKPSFTEEAPVEPESTPPAPEPVKVAASPIVSEPEDNNEEAVDEFMEIFLEEAEEILETCQSLLGRWQSSPNSMPLLKELQRELHTLKGGSRMVGISVMGDLSHHLESVLTKIVEGNAQSNSALQGIVQESVDELASMLEAVRNGEALTADPDLLTRIDSTLGGDMAVAPLPKPASKPEPTPQAVAEAAEKSQQTRKAAPKKAEKTSEEPSENDERVRVRAQLIDKLTNLAGEMAINRAHLEQQQGSSKLNLQEMEQTVMRLRDQLRRLEIETEAQILSHFGDSNNVSPDDEEFDPLEMDRFSVLQQLSRSLMETVNDLQSIQEAMSNLYRHTDSLLIQQSRVGAELQDGIMRTRMVPFSQISPRLQRIARLTSRELHKQVKFSVNDDSIEFERTVLNRIVAPLEHMLRNAIGHGIENGDTREKLGKPAVATVNIDLSQEGAELILKLTDDGAGINTEAIRKKAVERGMIKADEKVSDEELMQFVLQPAFSTAKTITQVSGRGVGMDIANNEIKQLGGTLEIHSIRGKGSTFEIRLPLSLTISQSLLIHLGEETMAVPLHNVDGVVRVSRQELQNESDDQKTYKFMGGDYRIAYLADMLGFPRASVDTSLLPIMLVSSSEQRIALVVDAIEGSKEVVVKSVGPQLSIIRWIAGATILGDGRVVIILDVLTLLRSHAAIPRSAIMFDEQAEEKHIAKTIMVVDDSITVRKVTARLLKRQGLEVMTAKDGVDAISQLQEHIPDLMLLDVEMPRMDGFELATQVRNSDTLKHIPIIMITSRTGTKHRERAAKIGINKHLGKPFNETELLENINALLGDNASHDTDNEVETAHE